MKDWERQAALLSIHDNRKFVKPVQRGMKLPVFERFDCAAGSGSNADTAMLIALAAALIVALVLAP